MWRKTTLVDQCCNRGLFAQELAKNRTTSPPPSSWLGRLFPLSAGADLHSLRGGLLVRPSKLSSIDPHAMQDDRELARDGDLGLAKPISLGQPHAPCL